MYSASGQVNIITLANPLQAYTGSSCVSQSFAPNVFSGSIDEFRVYSRELDIDAICALADP
jgi:hypothetical protein